MDIHNTCTMYTKDNWPCKYCNDDVPMHPTCCIHTMPNETCMNLCNDWMIVFILFELGFPLPIHMHA